MVKSLILYFITLTILAGGYYVFRMLRNELLPGAKRLRKNTRSYENGKEEDFGERLDSWIKKLIPETLYRRIEIYLIQNGQSHEWNVTKAIRSVSVSLLAGTVFSGFLILLYATSENAPVWLLLVALFTFPLYPIVPILNFKSGRKDFINKIIFQTPELLDILENELVQGAGNVEFAIDRAQRELEGELRNIMRSAYKYLQQNSSNYDGLCEFIQEQVNIPLYDQIAQLIKQFQMTGKAKRALDAIYKSTRLEINRVIRQQTQEKNLYITIVTMGILINLALLIGVPMVHQMLNIQLIPQ